MQNEEAHIDATLLTKFITGEVTKVEQLQVIEWLDTDPANQLEFDKLEAAWIKSGTLDPKPLPVDMPQAWNKLHTKIEIHDNQKRGIKRFLSPAVYVAASVAVIILLFNLIQTKEVSYTPVTVENLTGEQHTDTLPDGSVVTLNVRSRLTYLSRAEDIHRHMKLEGEAFFDVVRDTLRPFVIKAGMGGVRVLGTRFNVKVTNTTDVTVSVESGLVELFYPVATSNDTLRLKLTSGEEGKLSFQNSQLTSKKSTPSSFFWMDNTLIFKNKPLQDVFDVLEQCYGVNIICDDNNINLTNLSTTFRDKEVNEVLDVISATFNVAYRLEDKTYRIYRP